MTICMYTKLLNIEYFLGKQSDRDYRSYIFVLQKQILIHVLSYLEPFFRFSAFKYEQLTQNVV